MAIDTSVVLLGHKLKNPIIPASGTCGFGRELADIYDINCLGSLALKGTTLQPRYGNPLPRVAECPAGMLNAIGLQNPGVKKVIDVELPRLREVFRDKFIINIGGHSAEEYVSACSAFNGISDLLCIELNISCPNVKGGGLAFGVDPKAVETLVREIKKACSQKIMVKLSPNVTDVVSLALAAENGGADAISLINTLVGMRIDIKTGRPILSVSKGGYSGPGIFPVAVRMVYDVVRAVKIPVVGMGGVQSARDALELISAGAAAVMVGTANLVDPLACKNIVDDLPKVMKEYGLEKLGRSL
jgi:dihydroorotate dehydrogenase (NAD+) catalytic subunit